jgi:glucosamine 6-phosphate synthetase-like amidotransferase/phosphosugar isomerase protein
MCGVFGFVAEEGKRLDLRKLAAIAEVTETRGRDAWGMAWIDSRGVLHQFKRSGPITGFGTPYGLGLLRMAEDARILIGHCRLATHGSPAFAINNHPHPCDGGWYVHNGIVTNARRLIVREQLQPVSECDSEVLGLLLAQLEGTLCERTETLLEMVDGGLALLGLWKPGQMLAVRSGDKPLWIDRCRTGRYLASLREGLAANAKPVPIDSPLILTV